MKNLSFRKRAVSCLLCEGVEESRGILFEKNVLKLQLKSMPNFPVKFTEMHSFRAKFRLILQKFTNAAGFISYIYGHKKHD